MLPDPQIPDLRRRRFRRIPIRMLVPNVITLLALCAGLTAIRLAFEGRTELALGAIVFAAILDGIDGRVARMIKGQSRFGAELDSLADFVNFGVAPALTIGPLVHVAATAVLGAPPPEYHQSIWHGINQPQAMSAVSTSSGRRRNSSWPDTSSARARAS